MSFLVTELFHSLQGEGEYVGQPSVFLRLHGCNFTCEGFGQSRDRANWVPTDQLLHEQKNIIATAKSVEDLPVPTIGCDSSLSWAKATKHLAKSYESEDLMTRISATFPDTAPQYGRHLVITGGEPLIPKWQKQYRELLIDAHNTYGITHITFETNGTYELRDDLAKFFNNLLPNVKIIFSISAKLSISGEAFERACVPKAVSSYRKVANRLRYMKYVVRDIECLADIKRFNAEYAAENCLPKRIYLMPEGATVEGIEYTEKHVADMCTKYGFRFSPRLHLNLYKNSWGT